MKVANHRLKQDNGEPLPFRRSPNQSGAITPEYLIMHYTAGASAASAIDWLTNPAASASAHLVIARDGAITQLVPFNRKAWHAGRSRWAGRRGVNGFSIGIELDNFGVLTRVGDGWQTAWGKPVDPAEVVEAQHKDGDRLRGWHAYSEPQLEAALAVGSLLARRYGLKDVLGHEDVAPLRKTDPGPAFPMQSFRSAVMGRDADEPPLFETATALNIRSGPGSDHGKLPGSPLPAGTKLEVLAESGLWRRVDVLEPVGDEMDLEGWVHGRFIRLAG